jgi:hypothetical protein
MDADLLFYEKQRFHQWWLYLILIGMNGFFIYLFVQQVIFDKAFGAQRISNLSLSISALVSILITIFLANFKLEIKIKADGIYIRFFPFQLSYKHYSWVNISKLYVRKYSPLGEYGGWGYRYGSGGKAFTISGNQGLQIELVNHKKLLIGTQKAEEIESVLNNLGQLKN